MPTPAPRCKACSSADLIETNTQIRVHLAGLEGPNGAQIFLSMRALVCLDLRHHASSTHARGSAPNPTKWESTLELNRVEQVLGLGF
jgi:hypothetical protein